MVKKEDWPRDRWELSRILRKITSRTLLTIGLFDLPCERTALLWYFPPVVTIVDFDHTAYVPDEAVFNRAAGT